MNRRLIPFLLLLFVLLSGLVVLFAKIWFNPKPTTQTNTTIEKIKDPQIGLTLITTSVNLPTSIISTGKAGDGRLFITERDGVIRVLGEDGKLSSSSLLDIKSKVQSDGEMGLLGLAFHPNFTNNGYFYVNYVDKNRNTIVSRFKVNSLQSFADPATELQLLKIPQPYPNHNGGHLVFGPDNFLYIALGDGGSGGDPQNRAQNKQDYLGKILRIDVNNGNPYAIPDSNPFIKDSSTKKETWSLGWRNPWKFSFDKKTGEMWIADVGQGDIEEVNLEPANTPGRNYGWRCFEGSRNFNLLTCKDKSGYTFPILEYDHQQERCSVTGGFVYRGKKYPALVGQYFYGDFCTGEVFSAINKNGDWQAKVVARTPYKLSTFGEDSSGEIYLADFSTGSIYRIEDLAN